MMFHIRGKMTAAGITEMRTHSKELLEAAKDHAVVLQRHSEPVAVLMDYEQYLKMELMLEACEDLQLSELIRERQKSTHPKDYIDSKIRDQIASRCHQY